MKRKVSLFFMMVLCFFSVLLFGSTVQAAEDYDAKVMEDVARAAFDEWNTRKSEMYELLNEDLDSVKAMYLQYGMTEEDFDNMVTSITSWKNADEEFGLCKEITSVESVAPNAEDENYINVVLVVKSEKANLFVTIPVNKTSTVDSPLYNGYGIKLEEKMSMGQKMSKAGLNTLMGVGLVFVLLVVISLLISCLGLVGKIGQKKPEPKAPAATPAPAPAAPVAEAPVEENLVDDGELVAVITAAIMASMGDGVMEVPADGLVIRSIRRRRA